MFWISSSVSNWFYAVKADLNADIDRHNEMGPAKSLLWMSILTKKTKVKCVLTGMHCQAAKTIVFDGTHAKQRYQLLDFQTLHLTVLRF